MPGGRLWSKRTAGRLVDVAAFVVVWGGAGLAITGAFGSSIEVLVNPVLYGPIALPFILCVRLGPQLARLAEVGRRESLAVTLISPGAYLVPRLAWFGVGAVALFWPAYLAMLTRFSLRAGWFDNFFELAAVSGVLIGFLALAGGVAFLSASVAFWHMCRRRRADFWSSVLPCAYGGLGSGAVCAFVFLFLRLVDQSGVDEDVFCALTSVCAFLLSVVLVRAGVWTWRCAAEEYYVFE